MSEITYKGFNQDMTCLGHQFEGGGEYEHPGEVVCCPSKKQVADGKGGYHSCRYPLDVLKYYAPNTSRYFEVEPGGDIKENGDDSKIASKRLKIGGEIGIKGLVEAAIKFTFEKATWSEKDSEKEDYGAASATGGRGAASATGDYGAASATGDCGAASATGYYGAASATGYRGAASATGEDSVAMASGYGGKAKGKKGCVLFLVERDSERHIVAHKSLKIDGKRYKEDTYYTLCDGKAVEAE